MSGDGVPTVAQMAAAACQEVLDLIAEGIVPVTVESFSDLHAYVDANCLGGLCDDGFSEKFADNDAWLHYGNDMQDQVDAWLRAGGHREGAGS